MKMNVSKPARPSKASIAREAATQKAFSPKDIHELLKPQLQNLVQECVWGVYLDSRNNVLGIEEIAKGAVDHVETPARELFRPAVELAAVAVIMAHNHPSGTTVPSDDDKMLARRMIMCGEILGIPLVDSLVLTKDKVTSMASDSKMPEFAFPELVMPADPLSAVSKLQQKLKAP